MSAPPAGFTVESVEVHTAPDHVLGAMYAVSHEIEQEDLPEPPWEPMSEWIAELRADALVQDRADWVVHATDGTPASTGSFYATRTGENRHRAKLVVRVSPGLRRRGAGTHLLGLVVQAALDAGRTVVQSWTTAGGAGAAWAEAHGITAEDHLELNRLRTSDVDRNLLADWSNRAPERAADYELVAWDGRCPDELRARYAEVRQVMNTAPQTQDHVDELFTVEKLDELEASWEEGGLPWWTLCARHRSSGRLAGYTELTFSDEEPALAYQGDTAVDPSHRERGLGRWLKASLLERVLRERPAVAVVDTYNAGSNAAMITINRALGFRVVLRTERRRADLGDVATRMGLRTDGAGVS